jgi:plasmid stability protein
MATLYVESIPDELYEALRGRAREHRNSIAAEVLRLLEENVPTAREIKARQEFLRQVRRLQSRRPQTAGSYASTEKMQRQDRMR